MFPAHRQQALLNHSSNEWFYHTKGAAAVRAAHTGQGGRADLFCRFQRIRRPPVVQHIHGGKACGQQRFFFVFDGQGRIVVIQPIVLDALLHFEAEQLGPAKPFLLVRCGKVIRQDNLSGAF